MTMFRVLYITSILISLSLVGCKNRVNGAPEAIHFDRDSCARCAMVISERKFATEIIEPKSNRAFKFDDIGCAILWLEEGKFPWAKRAKIWVKDAKSGKWLNAKDAKYTTDFITPMAYGVASFSNETFPKGKKALNFNQVVDLVKKIEAKNNQMRGLSSQ